ncbi:serine/threonine protein kinase [Nocardiopsis sp. RSe5-2]|uniref:non-specific serine/threonine protein kinase n=1 Tax=Nocardiopsis endophytica TaxID=3018445 RepID=A0ABT4UDG3_9ACTN|nr:serine/threonine protein kinase [Nocardiopsis endophytica]MDA2815006.1 serine/threonine protein kinase [Nocardiopsis endophytica]
MADPQHSDPDTPHDPAAQTTRLDPVAEKKTRWVTRVLRPGGDDSGPTVRVGRQGGASGAGATTPTGPTARTARASVPRQAARAAAGATAVHQAGRPAWWRRAVAAVSSWFARIVARVVVGPAGDLDYAVPADLRGRYTVLGRIGAGGEAVVYLAEPAAPAGDGPRTRLALKVYRPGHDINRELLERLRARGTADPHAPSIHGYGHAGSTWGDQVAWEAQEYFPEGSLRALLEGAPLEDGRARELVGAVADCLRHWQEELQHNHTDVKPENLLIRSVDPPVFALTDFGGAVRATMSRVYGTLAITEEYAAPEVVEGRREAPAAWWSLGVMAHEMVAGRRPPRRENWLTARTDEIDVSAVADERWRLLVRGLLAPVPAERWGAEEVRRWLDGETPQVARAGRNAPIVSAGTTHADPPSLAFDLQDRSDKGAMWLRTHWSALRTWLDREVNDYTFDREHLTALQDRPELAHAAISALAAHYIPGMTPRYRGLDVSADGVLALATGERARHELLREAVETGAVGLAARHWCGHPGCHAEGAHRCALLERVQHEVPRVMREAEASVRRLTEQGAGDFSGLDRHGWDGAWAHAAELVLDPEAASRERRWLRSQAWNPAQRGPAWHADWWAELRRSALAGAPGEIGTNASLVALDLVTPVATAVGAEVRRRSQAEGRMRRKERWESARRMSGEALASARGHLTSVTHRKDTGQGPGQGQGAPGQQPGGPGQAGPGRAWPWQRPGDPGGSGQAGRQPYPPYDPNDPLARYRPAQGPQGQDRRPDKTAKGLRQIERAMTAGRCRRFAYPAALLGALDATGRAMLPPEGFFPSSDLVLGLYEGLLGFRHSAPVTTVADGASALAGLVPGDAAMQWWSPLVLAVVLVLLGRTAASKKRKARTQLGAYRLAVAGSVAMAVLLAAGGLLTLGAGILVPLDGLLGG